MPILYITHHTNKELAAIQHELATLRLELERSKEPLHLIFAREYPVFWLELGDFGFDEMINHQIERENIQAGASLDLSEEAKMAYGDFLKEHANQIQCVKIYMHNLQEKKDVFLYTQLLAKLSHIEKLVIVLDHSERVELCLDYYNPKLFVNLSHLLTPCVVNPKKIKTLYLNLGCFSPHLNCYRENMRAQTFMEHQSLVELLDFIQQCIFIEKIHFESNHRLNGCFFDKLMHGLSRLTGLNELYIDVFDFNVTTLSYLLDNHAIKKLSLKLLGTPYFSSKHQYLFNTELEAAALEDVSSEGYDSEGYDSEEYQYTQFLTDFQRFSRAVSRNYTLRELLLDLSLINYASNNSPVYHQINPFLFISYNQSLKKLKLQPPCAHRFNWNCFVDNFSKNNIECFDFNIRQHPILLNNADYYVYNHPFRCLKWHEFLQIQQKVLEAYEVLAEFYKINNQKNYYSHHFDICRLFTPERLNNFLTNKLSLILNRQSTFEPSALDCYSVIHVRFLVRGLFKLDESRYRQYAMHDWSIQVIKTILQLAKQDKISSRIQLLSERCAQVIDKRQKAYQQLLRVLPKDKCNLDPAELSKKILSAEKGSVEFDELTLTYHTLMQIVLKQSIHMSTMLFVFLVPFHHENQKNNGQVYTSEGHLVKTVFSDKFAQQWYPLFFGIYLPLPNDAVVNVVSFSTIQDLRRFSLVSKSFFGKCKHSFEIIDAQQSSSRQDHAFLRNTKRKMPEQTENESFDQTGISSRPLGRGL